MSFTEPDKKTGNFFLVDCNAFFVSCEQAFNPKLRNQPVVVLSNNDGCVIARSKQAKALGIPMGAPAFQYASLFREKNVHVYSSNFPLYADMSSRVMQVLSQFTCDMQIYSIDEAFLYMDCANPIQTAQDIKEKVLRWTAIPISIGIGKTKTLAKVANDLAKRASGIFAFEGTTQKEALFSTLPVAEVWGIGNRLNQRLNAQGIRTVLQLIRSDKAYLKKLFSISMLKIVLELEGVCCLDLEETPAPKRSITCSRSFAEPIDTFTDLSKALCSYTARAAEKLRLEASIAGCLHVFVSTSNFINLPYANSCTYILTEPTNYTPKLIAAAKEALKKIYLKDYVYKKVGITLMDLISEKSYQRDLFQDPLLIQGKQNQAMKILDQLNQKLGKQSVRFGSEMNQLNHHRKTEHCSPSFTTNFDELLTVQI